MQIQNSFQEDDEQGTLYIVPTPIGNLEDISYRALTILKSVNVIAAEDTRHTKKLLHYFNISTSLLSYHEHSKETRKLELLQLLQEGKDVALVSDAGMPAISDPGYDLIEAVIQENISVITLPGANAALCALVASGLSTKEFYFYGFLSRHKKEKLEEVERLKTVKATILFYESPHRLLDTLKLLKNEWGHRQATIARELTKKFEQYIRGTLSELVQWAEENELKGEFCLVIEGNQSLIEENNLWWGHLSVIEHVNYYIDHKALTSKEAIKRVATERKMAKRDVYNAFHIKN